MEYKQIERDMVVRTLELLQECPTDDKNDVTRLINYAYGLIVYPKVKLHYSKWPKYVFTDTDITYGFSKQQIISVEMGNYYLRNITRHIRNGLAHGLIKGYSENGIIKYLEISDRADKKEYENFKLECTIEEFKSFAVQIAKTYLKLVPEKIQ